MTLEDQEIWKRIKSRTGLWSLNLLSRDHWNDVEIFNSGVRDRVSN
jgi:hypothetical protein